LDLVIFTGDLVQSGANEQFERLETVVHELWEKFRNWGSEPKLILLPGNHDICRAPSLSAELRLLRRWWEEHEIHRDFFNSDGNSYRHAIHNLFSEYDSWTSRTTIPTLSGTPGLLPGDQSHTLNLGTQKVGIVTLNSTWLQIDDSDYLKKLHVDTKQLLKVTKDDPHAWCEENAFNIIVTHHPLDWLHDDSQSYWHSDINPHSRFDLHLYGHMHEAASASLSTGGLHPVPKTPS
jgi:predicted phosphodiesterase